jgi:ribosomal protein S12 methylthiotransferase
MKRFYIHKLGCPKNDVDADYIAGFLRSQNLLQVRDPEQADILIVNSCGFIQPAKEESIDAVLSMARLKGSAQGKKLIVTGCLSQRYAAELEREIPELDGIFGLYDFTDITKLLNGHHDRLILSKDAPQEYPVYNFARTINPDEFFAYLKISDGCDNRCSYCAIPDIRGHFRSRIMDAIVEEAGFLLESGKKELIIVSQEATAYGRDLYGRSQLIPLLDRLSQLNGDFWIRVMYLHPARLSEDLIDYMIDNSRICSYFDLPLQHICDDILEVMKRKVTRDRIEKLLDRIRSARERAVIRTNFIVGFPGETDQHFEELCRFIEGQCFDRLGAFVYSREDGTRAAELKNQVDETTKEKRYHKLMELQQQIAFDRNLEEVGRCYDLLVESVDKASCISYGRTRFDAPEIDQTVRLGFDDIEPGEFVKVKITGCDGYDLIGGRTE